MEVKYTEIKGTTITITDEGYNNSKKEKLTYVWIGKEDHCLLTIDKKNLSKFIAILKGFQK